MTYEERQRAREEARIHAREAERIKREEEESRYRALANQKLNRLRNTGETKPTEILDDYGNVIGYGVPDFDEMGSQYRDVKRRASDMIKVKNKSEQRGRQGKRIGRRNGAILGGLTGSIMGGALGNSTLNSKKNTPLFAGMGALAGAVIAGYLGGITGKHNGRVAGYNEELDAIAQSHRYHAQYLVITKDPSTGYNLDPITFITKPEAQDFMKEMAKKGYKTKLSGPKKPKDTYSDYIKVQKEVIKQYK